MSAGPSDPVRYFGRQVRKERLAAGWTLAEFGQRTGYDPAHLGRVENGKRPATELLAQLCDQVFPSRCGWFTEFYEESRTWIATPPWFRDWVEREQRGKILRNWYLGVVDGLLQTEGYARAIQSVTPKVTEDDVNARVAARLKRQAILTREDPPTTWFLVDQAALRRCIGSPAVMAAQMAQLAAIARLPNVTIQVVPENAHAGLRRRVRPHRQRRLRGDRGRWPGIRRAGNLHQPAHPLRYAQERGTQGVRVPGPDRADRRAMGSNWRKSSHSADNGGACVEVSSAEAVLVRDTTDRGGPALTFSADAWQSFTKSFK